MHAQLEYESLKELKRFEEIKAPLAVVCQYLFICILLLLLYPFEQPVVALFIVERKADIRSAAAFVSFLAAEG